MKSISSYLVIAALSLAATSCKKDDASPSKTDMLTAKKWKTTAHISVVTTNGQSTTVDAYANQAPCEHDNFFKLNSDKSFVSDEGADVCAGGGQSETGTWALNADQTKLVFTTSGNDNEYDLLELTSSTLKLKHTFTFGNTTYTDTVTNTAF